MEDYLVWCEFTRGRSGATIKTYATTLYQYVRWIGDSDLSEHGTETMQEFVRRPRERRGRGQAGAAATQSKDVAILKMFHAWLSDNDADFAGPSLARGLYGPAVHNTNPKPVSDDAWRALVQCDMTRAERVAWGLAFYCGLRRAELLELRRDNFRNGLIVDFVRKGGGEDSTPWEDMLGVYQDHHPSLVDELWESDLHYLISHHRSDNPKLLGWYGTVPETVNKRLTRVCHMGGIPHLSPHMFRHAAATNLIRAGVDIHIVSRLMNHSDIQTTMRYVKAGAQELSEWRRRKART